MSSSKRKKLEKLPETIPQGNHKFICCRCGTAFSRQKGFFPVSHSPMYRGSGYLPFCTECIDAMYEYYRALLNDDREAMRRMCMKLDLYWNDSIYDMVERTAGVQSRIRSYIGKTNIIRYIDKTFDDTLLEDEKKNTDNSSGSLEFNDEYLAEDEPVSEDLPPVDQKVIDFWGTGYQPSFYYELERRYKDWTGGNKVVDAGERSLYKQICLLETIIARDSARGKSIDKNVNTLNTLLGSMNLKPAQRKDDVDAELEKTPLGVGIQMWENRRPLPETADELKDKSGIIKDITTWFLGHACKMVGLKNSYCKLYEDAMDELRVKRPELADEDDDTLLADIFGNVKSGGDEN